MEFCSRVEVSPNESGMVVVPAPVMTGKVTKSINSAGHSLLKAECELLGPYHREEVGR